MIPTTATNQTRWTAEHTAMFSACKDMFHSNPLTGGFEQKTDKDNWYRLVSNIIRISQGEQPSNRMYNSQNAASGLSQIVIWPGGKKNELKYILPNVPSYERFFEPFVGGGSVFMGINADEYFINDFCSDLTSLYRYIASSDEMFLRYIDMIDKSMVKADEFFIYNKVELSEIYGRFLSGALSDMELKHVLSDWCRKKNSKIPDIIGEFSSYSYSLSNYLQKYLYRRYRNMKKKKTTDASLISTDIEIAVKGALYIFFRHLYNDSHITKSSNALHTALFLYLRQNVFGGKFTYNKKGEFCESYGGGSLVNKRLDKKLEYFRSDKVKDHFRTTHIYNMDFEEFLHRAAPSENDFVFLDPPYDCEFSTYDKNEFSRKDQRRLADYLLNKCKARWMMIINKTDFIYNLYNRSNIHIKEYDKTYSCNMKNNNKRDTTHLMITNYPLSDEKTLFELSHVKAA